MIIRRVSSLLLWNRVLYFIEIIMNMNIETWERDEYTKQAMSSLFRLLTSWSWFILITSWFKLKTIFVHFFSDLTYSSLIPSRTILKATPRLQLLSVNIFLQNFKKNWEKWKTLMKKQCLLKVQKYQDKLTRLTVDSS